MISLPNENNWQFECIKRDDPDRAKTLESAGPPEGLVNALASALKSEFDRKNVRWGWENAVDSEGDCRAVIQFQATPELFDWFFNARTGYRAHYRASVELGLSFNSQIIQAIRDCVDANIAGPIAGRELKNDFQDVGPIQIRKRLLLKSLDRKLSKLWLCGKLILPKGGIKPIPMGYGGPKLILNSDRCWEALYLGTEPIWLDCKGAFSGEAEIYQIKCPLDRARKLHVTGRA